MTLRMPARLPALAVGLYMVLAGTLPALAAPAALDSVAEAYVRLVLKVGEHEEGYVDAYYGPKEWAEAAKADKGTVPALTAEAKRLIAAAAAVDEAPLSPLERKRKRFLTAQLKAVEARLEMIAGTRWAFAEEAERLFGVRPEVPTLASYDAALKELEALLPGEGPLNERLEKFRAGLVVPKEKLDAVMRAAIAECRKRTATRIPLPAKESFELAFVVGKPWSGYNWYKGDGHSLIEVNTDLPVHIDRAVDLGCHEGYPGHHVQNLLLEDRLSKGKGWVEFTVNPLFSPNGLIAEGTANYGIEIAFPGPERAAFERTVLYPLAGLDPDLADRFAAVDKAMRKLRRANFAVADAYLAGRIDREEAIRQLMTFTVASRKRAERSLSFIETYRSYIINYSLGLDMARSAVEKAGPDPAARWTKLESLLAEPTVPADLK